jgi:tetratricopeptide (TPR) repeat protein
MGFRRDARDSAKLPVVLPKTIAYFVGMCVFLAALAGLAYESGKPSQHTHSSAFLQSILATLVKPAVSIPLASVLVVICTALFRLFWFDVQAAKPGPIQVNDLVPAAGVTDADIPQLTAAFRRRLMEMRLHAPEPIPGTAPTQDLLTMLDSEQLDPKNPLATLVRILRVALPTHAYEVSVSLVEEPATPPAVPRRGVTAQLTRLPYEALPVTTAWAFSWNEAIVKAADQVTAAILPRTVLSNRPPWEGWRQYPMPRELVHHFEMAQELTSDRRYDEALDHYYKALELDPKNVDLRLHKGFVEEKLGLYVDAAMTYRAACKLSKTSGGLYGFGASRKRKATGAIARYRLAILLSGPKFAEQWRDPGANTLRDKQRRTVRERLRPELEDLLRRRRCLKDERFANDPPRATGEPKWVREDVHRLLGEPGPARKLSDGGEAEPDQGYYELRNVLAHLARRELTNLTRFLRRSPAIRAWLTTLSVELTIACVDVRLDYLRHKLDPYPGWSLDPPTKPPVHRLARTRTWTQRYNTAALFSLPLLVEKGLIASTPEDDRVLRNNLTERAIEQLKLAMASSVSWYAAQRRDWVLSEDPDLDGLRRRPEFKQFEALYFPSASRTALRPKNVQMWEQSKYTNALLSEMARRWESVWHRRREALGRSADPHVVIQWCVAEADAWRLIEDLAHNYEHWVVRRDLIARMKDWSAQYEFSAIEVAVPRFSPTQRSDDECVDCEAEDDIKHITERLAALGCELGPLNGSPGDAVPPGAPGHWWIRWHGNGNGDGNGHHPSQFERLQSELRNRDFWHRQTPKLYLPAVCDVHAAMWQRLHEWLEAPPDQAEKAKRAFAGAREQAGRMSGTTNGMWFVAVVERRVHLMTSGDGRVAVSTPTASIQISPEPGNEDGNGDLAGQPNGAGAVEHSGSTRL